jgi:hypothetical protein
LGIFAVLFVINRNVNVLGDNWSVQVYWVVVVIGVSFFFHILVLSMPEIPIFLKNIVLGIVMILLRSRNSETSDDGSGVFSGFSYSDLLLSISFKFRRLNSWVSLNMLVVTVILDFDFSNFLHWLHCGLQEIIIGKKFLLSRIVVVVPIFRKIRLIIDMILNDLVFGWRSSWNSWDGNNSYGGLDIVSIWVLYILQRLEVDGVLIDVDVGISWGSLASRFIIVVICWASNVVVTDDNSRSGENFMITVDVGVDVSFVFSNTEMFLNGIIVSRLENWSTEEVASCKDKGADPKSHVVLFITEPI